MPRVNTEERFGINIEPSLQCAFMMSEITKLLIELWNFMGWNTKTDICWIVDPF